MSGCQSCEAPTPRRGVGASACVRIWANSASGTSPRSRPSPGARAAPLPASASASARAAPHAAPEPSQPGPAIPTAQTTQKVRDQFESCRGGKSSFYAHIIPGRLEVRGGPFARLHFERVRHYVQPHALEQMPQRLVPLPGRRFSPRLRQRGHACANGRELRVDGHGQRRQLAIDARMPATGGGRELPFRGHPCGHRRTHRHATRSASARSRSQRRRTQRASSSRNARSCGSIAGDSATSAIAHAPCSRGCRCVRDVSMSSHVCRWM